MGMGFGAVEVSGGAAPNLGVLAPRCCDNLGGFRRDPPISPRSPNAMRPLRYRLALVALALVTAAPTLAQQADSTAAPTVRVFLKGGSEVVGTIQAERDTEIEFVTRSEIAMTIDREQIERIVEVEEAFVGGRYVRLDPNRTRLFFAPTARPLGNGRGYFADYYLFFPFVAYGAGDAVSLAGGVSILPFSPVQVAYVAPKVTMYNGRHVSVGMGAFVGFPFGVIGPDDGWVGLLYGLGTFGGAQTSATVGVGFGAFEGDFSSRPAVLVGLERQVSGSVKLISENYAFFPEGDATLLVSGGIRFFGARLAADLAFFTSPEAIGEGGFPLFPFVGFAYNFGQ